MPERNFCESIDDVRGHYGSMLRKLIGQTVEDTWIAWDEDAGEWFAEEPVILRIAGSNYEIVFSQLSQLAITRDTLDVMKPPNWWRPWDEMDVQLVWKKNALPEMQFLVGHRIDSIRLVEYLFETKTIVDRENPWNVGKQQATWLFNGLEFKTVEASVTIFNALDQNGKVYPNVKTEIGRF